MHCSRGGGEGGYALVAAGLPGIGPVSPVNLQRAKGTALVADDGADAPASLNLMHGTARTKAAKSAAGAADVRRARGMAESFT